MSMVQSGHASARALLSVSDKTGLESLARGLHQAGYELLSTGGTASYLQQLGVPVTPVSAVTKFPEIMGGRVKTLHPAIHGGILARRDEDAAVMAEHGIQAIDVVVVNLYPFQATVARPGCLVAEAIEQIDIGGPAMVRAAAKNHAWVSILVDPADYPDFLASLQNDDASIALQQRRRWAAKAYAHTSQYDAAVSSYLSQQLSSSTDETEAQVDASLPAQFILPLQRERSLRYGENPQQSAALYCWADHGPTGLAGAVPLQGKALSYNNLLDADAAWQLARRWHEEAACVIVKHGNPCGAAIAEELSVAYAHALAADPQSAFGGIIACNREVDEASATAMAQLFAEVIIAPAFSAEARAALAHKTNLRLLAMPLEASPDQRVELRSIDGGVLVQARDLDTTPMAQWRVVSRAQASAADWQDLAFAWQVCRSVKSNAIVYARDGQTLGIGAGQMSRVDSARFAREKAAQTGADLARAVMASDAFLPFPDSVEEAAAAGVRAIVQPGGSVRDDQVIAAADAHDIVLVLTGRRHFRH